MAILAQAAITHLRIIYCMGLPVCFLMPFIDVIKLFTVWVPALLEAAPVLMLPRGS